MVRLNTAASIREYHSQVYKFNRYVNYQKQRGLRRHPLNMDITGFEAWFKLWLSAILKINDNNLHLTSIEKNYNPKRLYFQRSKGRQTIINR